MPEASHRRAVWITTWALVAWVVSAAVCWLLYAGEQFALDRATSYPAAQAARANMRTISYVREVAAVVCVIAMVIGLVKLVRAHRAVAPDPRLQADHRATHEAIVRAAVVTGALLVWWLVFLANRELMAIHDASRYALWMSRLRLLLVIGALTSSLFALARLGFGRRGWNHYGFAGVAAALVIWRFGAPLWSSWAGLAWIEISRPLAWAAIQTLAMVPVVGIAIMLARWTGGARGRAAETSWWRFSDGLLTASYGIHALAVAVIAIVLSLPMFFFMMYIYSVGLMICTGVLAVGLFLACRCPSQQVASRSAAALACALLLLAWLAQSIPDGMRLPDTGELAALFGFAVALSFAGLLRRLALEIGADDSAATAAVQLLAIVGFAAVTGVAVTAVDRGWVSGGWKLAMFAALGLVGVSIALSTSFAGQQLAKRIKEQGPRPAGQSREITNVPTAIIRSQDESPRA